MAIAEMSGQIGYLILFGIGVVIILLFVLIARVSAVKKMLETLDMKLTPAKPVTAAKAVASVPKSRPASVATGPAAVPNEVIAAICAAVNQYSIEYNT